MLLEHGVPPTSADTATGRTPLHWSAACTEPNHAEICIRALVLAGADLDSVGHREACGQTPLHVALSAGLTQNACVLVRHGCDVNKVSSCKRGISPVLLAAESGDVNMLRLLLAGGADVRNCWVFYSRRTSPLDVISQRLSTDTHATYGPLLELLLKADGNLPWTLSYLPPAKNHSFQDLGLAMAVNMVLNRLKRHHRHLAVLLIQALIVQGFRPKHDTKSLLMKFDSRLAKWLNWRCSAPTSLTELCVSCVRASMQRNVFWGIRHVSVNDTIKKQIINFVWATMCLLRTIVYQNSHSTAWHSLGGDWNVFCRRHKV